MRRIKLTNCDRYVLVDNDDYDILSNYKWRGRKSHGTVRYAEYGKESITMHGFLITDIPDNYIIDHINNDGLDNRRENLRVIPKKKNAWNRDAYKGRRFKGTAKVTKSNKYQARIRYEGKLIYLGSYNTEEEAAHAYDRKAIELFGELANLNFKCED